MRTARPVRFICLAVATIAVAVLASCDRLPERLLVESQQISGLKPFEPPKEPSPVGFSDSPAVQVAGGSIYVIALEEGGKDSATMNLVVFKRSLDSPKWDRQKTPLPRSFLDPDNKGMTRLYPLSGWVMPDGKVVFLYNRLSYPLYVHGNALFVVDRSAGAIKRLDVDSPYTGFLGMTEANGTIYAVLYPDRHQSRGLLQHGRLPRTLLVELTPGGKPGRRLSLEVQHPLLHSEPEAEDFLPMAIAGQKLFIIENPGIASEVGDPCFRLRGALQIVDIPTFKLERTIDLPGLDEGISGYALSSDGSDLYVLERSSDSAYTWFQAFRLLAYDKATGTLREAGHIPASAEGVNRINSFCVVNGAIYVPHYEAVVKQTAPRMFMRFGVFDGLREVGRIEGAPAGAPGK